MPGTRIALPKGRNTPEPGQLLVAGSLSGTGRRSPLSPLNFPLGDLMRVSPCVSFCVLALGIALLAGCGGGDEGAAGATASLSWDPIADSSITYTVHYGKDSSGIPGSCNYEHAVDVSEPGVIVSGLEFQTTYYFAVSAFNGERSLCSNEVSKQTPEMELNIGDTPVDVYSPSSQCEEISCALPQHAPPPPPCEGIACALRGHD